MIFKLKKIKFIAIGFSIFFYINSCGKKTVVSNSDTHGPGPNLPYGNDDEPGQVAKDVYKKNIDSETYLDVAYFPIQDEFSKKEDFDGVIQNAGNGKDKDLTWAIGGGGLNGACSSFVHAKKYELYEIINQGKVKKSNLDCSKARSLLSKEECEGLDNFVYKGEQSKPFESQFSCLFKSKHNEQLGCKLITFSNETVAKDGKYFLMLYQVGPNHNLYKGDGGGTKSFIENLLISNNCFFQVIAKNQGLLEGKTIYFSGVSNSIFASGVNIDLGNGKNTAVENILNAMAVKNFNDLGKYTKIKIVLNKDTAVAYNFIKDKGKEEVLNLLKSATGVNIK